MEKVTKAVIIGAGLGSRMYPYTKVESKLMIPILNKPMIEYLVEELVDSGIKEVIIISNHISKIKQLFTPNQGLNEILKKLRKESCIDDFHHIECMCKIDLIQQELPYGWMHEILHAKEFLKNSPFIVCFSDILYRAKPPATKQLIKEFNKTGKNIRATARFIIKPETFNIIEKEKYSFGEDVADLDVFDKLRKNNDLLEFNIKGDLYNIGDPLSYVETETEFALLDKKFGKDYKEFLRKLLNK